jgi:DNA mismatch repair protein MutS
MDKSNELKPTDKPGRDNPAELTPVMQQYMDVKEAHPDAIVLFRMGDFYEMFGEDAKTASRILQIALTTRDKNKKTPMPMCGVPYHSVAPYIKKLVDAGYKVAVCEQVEDASEAKGIVRREVVKVITRGTFEPEDPRENIFILAFKPEGGAHGIALADVSTGQFMLFESRENLADELARFSVKEVLCPASVKNDIHYSIILSGYFVSYFDDYRFDHSEAYRELIEHFKVATLEGFGCDGMRAAVSAAGALLSYLKDTQKAELSVGRLNVLNVSAFMFLDASAVKNLELIKSDFGGRTLVNVLDHTLTPMGGRFLREALLKPLIEKPAIDERIAAVAALHEDYELRGRLRVLLKRVQDIERLTVRLVKGNAGARDLSALKNSLSGVPEFMDALLKSADPFLMSRADMMRDFSPLVKLIDDAVSDSPPPGVKDGGIIKDGYNAQIDELRTLSLHSKEYLTGLEARERAATGIALKVGFNRVFGYYIEVTNPNIHLVPPHYTRKQTLVNAERFITGELKELEDKILGAEEKLKNLEYHIFKEICDKSSAYADDLFETSRGVAQADFAQGLAEAAKRGNYCRPTISETGAIRILGGRHPVLETISSFGAVYSSAHDRFIPNDLIMDTDENRMMVITGPNMAGKSTYMRQAALLVLMAQTGSFVPAASAEIGIADRIFTRIGAADYLTKGQSTFMVEMIETANIVNNATRRSLIILDEVGRGTSTFDGISIAWAVAEFIANYIGARTLFATHYNELTDLPITTAGVRNYNVMVKEWGDEIIFMRKIERGAADKSYGIQVARLAGLPDVIIKRAREVLETLEQDELADTGLPKFAAKKRFKPKEQMGLFDARKGPVVERILGLDVAGMTPEEAMKELRELRELAEG